MPEQTRLNLPQLEKTGVDIDALTRATELLPRRMVARIRDFERYLARRARMARYLDSYETEEIIKCERELFDTAHLCDAHPVIHDILTPAFREAMLNTLYKLLKLREREDQFSA